MDVEQNHDLVYDSLLALEIVDNDIFCKKMEFCLFHFVQ